MFELLAFNLSQMLVDKGYSGKGYSGKGYSGKGYSSGQGGINKNKFNSGDSGKNGKRQVKTEITREALWSVGKRTPVLLQMLRYQFPGGSRSRYFNLSL